MATATLTGPVLLPGDDEPVVGAQVRVKLVAGGARTPGHVAGSARQGEWSDVTGDDGDFSVEVPVLAANDSGNFPATDYLLVTVGGGRHPTYQVKVKPTTEGSWVFSDPAIRVFTDVPPEVVFAQPQVTSEQAAAAIASYLTDNPVDVSAEVEAYFGANPPLLVANNGSDVDDPAAFLTAIGGATPASVTAASDAIRTDLDPLLLKESTEPAVRSDTPNVKLQIVDGSVYVEIDS